MKTFEQLIGVFYDNALKSFIIDYNNKNSIRRANNNVDKYRKAAKTIGLLYPELIENYINILFNSNKNVALCAAICLVELMPHSKRQLSMAVQVVEQYINDCDEAMQWGLKQWLQMYGMKE